MTYRPMQRAIGKENSNQIQKYMNTYLSNLCEYLVTKRNSKVAVGGVMEHNGTYIHTYIQTKESRFLDRLGK